MHQIQTLTEANRTLSEHNQTLTETNEALALKVGTLTDANAQLREDLELSNEGVYNLIRTQLGLTPRYRAGGPANGDAKRMNKILYTLKAEGLIHKRGPRGASIWYFVSRDAARRGKMLIALM